jgi:hypothetical protein
MDFSDLALNSRLQTDMPSSKKKAGSFDPAFVFPTAPDKLFPEPPDPN